MSIAYTPWSETTPAKVESSTLVNGCTGDTLTWGSVVLDSFGRPVKEQRKILGPSGSCTTASCISQRTTEYNAMGWQTAVSEWQLDTTLPANVKKTVFTRDHFGRATNVRPPDAVNANPNGIDHNVAFAYTGQPVVSQTVERATTQLGEENSTTTWTSDNLGRLIKVEEPASGGGIATTSYTYNAGGNLTVATTTVGTTVQTRTFAYDGRGFLTSETLPEKGNVAVTYPQYNALGNVLRIDDRGIRLAMSYDGVGRIANVTEANNDESWTTKRTLKTFTYATTSSDSDRANGMPLTATSTNWSSDTVSHTVAQTYTYGGVGGRVSSVSTSLDSTHTFAQSFTWDALGQLISENYPQRTGIGPQRTITYTRSYGMLKAVPGFASGIAYHPNGLMAQINHASGIVTKQDNDPNSMPRPYKIYTQGSGMMMPQPPPDLTDWSSATYAYDGAGNLKGLGTSYFTYDSAGRLTHSQPRGGDTWQNYTYDGFGNLTKFVTKIEGGSEMTRDVPVSTATNRLTGPTYNDRGQMLSWGTATYSWYPTGWLATLTDTGLNQTYIYSADGERTVTIDNLTNAWRVTLRGLDGKVRRVYTKAADGTWVWDQDYVYRDGGLLATIDPAVGTLHFHLDHLGSIRDITNCCTHNTGYHAFFGFGEQAYTAQWDSESMQFTGHERDLHATVASTDDLDYMHARYYNLNLARFLSPDPLRGDLTQPKTFNLYAYVSGNPMTLVDPFGLQENPGQRLTGVTDEITVIGEWDYLGWGEYGVDPHAWQHNNWYMHQPPYLPVGTGTVTPPDKPPKLRDPNRPCGGVPGADPGRPDFATAALNLGLGLGVTFQASLDRYGRLYLGVGPSGGKPGAFFSWSAMAGSLNQLSAPTSEELNGFLLGWNISATAGFGGGVTEAWTPSLGWSGFATETGVASPQSGVSVTHSWSLGCISEGW